MTLALISLLVLAIINGEVQGDPAYCLCSQKFVYDPTAGVDCRSSGTYGLSNACYSCPVVNASGIFYYCGSLPYLGYGFCEQAGALAARMANCAAIGGDTSLTSFVCTDSFGPNNSQWTACGTVVTSAPTTPTATPTSGNGTPVGVQTQGPSPPPTNDTSFRSICLPLMALVTLILMMFSS
jgi:hypothetical protein